MIIIEQLPEVNNKSNKFIVFVLNDHYDVKIRPVVFGSIISIMAVITVLIPYIALLTVPTYLAILFAVVSEKVDYITEADEENTLESE
jgi:cyclophilin family peptidyl-prolyl cis-trans isomerase